MSYILYNIKKNNIEEIKKENVLDKLYYNKYRIPNTEELKLYLKKNKKLENIDKFKKIEDYVEYIRDNISKIDNKISLYDKYNENLYLINRNNVYNRVIFNHFRFPSKNIINNLINKKYKEKDKILSDRNKKKYNLINNFLLNFNLEILFETYVKIFYESSNRELTYCYKPSFMYYKHMKPFYKRSEIINLALNMGLIKPNKILYTKDKLKDLCVLISNNDISSFILKKHLNHIIINDCIGVVQYYSLQGSFFINEYLRENVTYNIRNLSLEKIIESMWNLILKAPKFDKKYVLYRFIKEDNHIKNLEIGNIYITPSFMSTTRDPFYNSENLKFGFILIKINIPKDIEGVALCIETVSQFPEEQEILFSPLTKLKLINKDNNIIYYHNDENFKSKIKTKYEFNYISNNKVIFPNIYKNKTEDNLINFLNLEDVNYKTIEEKLKYFISSYTDDKYQFNTKIGENIYEIFIEWYDSTDIYDKYYSMKSINGFSMYSFKNNNMLFFIEIGNIDGKVCMYIDYYFRYSTKGLMNEIEEKDYLIFLSSIALFFKVDNLIIFCQYNFCNLKNKNTDVYRGGYYNLDIYKYMKYKKKKYNYSSIIAKFSYLYLNDLFNTSPSDILSREDNDELYQIYQEYIKNNKNNLSDFYLWIVDNYCFLLNLYIEKIDKLFNIEQNPFREKNEYYIIEYGEFLYNNKIIDNVPHYKKKTLTNNIKFIVKNKNMYRINTSLRIR
jgi:hypothetical protein